MREIDSMAHAMRKALAISRIQPDAVYPDDGTEAVWVIYGGKAVGVSRGNALRANPGGRWYGAFYPTDPEAPSCPAPTEPCVYQTGFAPIIAHIDVAEAIVRAMHGYGMA
jgi:hypothetical protein